MYFAHAVKLQTMDRLIAVITRNINKQCIGLSQRCQQPQTDHYTMDPVSVLASVIYISITNYCFLLPDKQNSIPQKFLGKNGSLYNLPEITLGLALVAAVMTSAEQIYYVL